MTERAENAEIRVSVIVPAYNAATTLARTLDSLMAQTRKADEIILVDDGSTDETAEIAKRYPAVRCLSQANTGLPGARNSGIKAARGNWIAFLDADDEWLPSKLERQVEHLTRHPDLAWTSGNFCRCLSQDDPGVVDIDPARARQVLGGREYHESYFGAYLQHVNGCVDTMLIRRDVFDEVGLFNLQQKRTEDMELWFRIAYRHERIGYLAEPLARYYVDQQESLLRRPAELEYVCLLIDRHLVLAEEHGQLEAFGPCAVGMIGYWIDRLLHEGRGSDIRALLRRYKRLFTPYFRVTTFLSSLMPRQAGAYQDWKRRRKAQQVTGRA